MKNILNRKNLFSSHATLVIVSLIAILIIVNLISFNHFTRLDLTEEQQYTLSESTIKTVQRLDSPLFIKLYFSEKLPPNLQFVSQYVKDILSEYKSHSSKINIEFIDPVKDDKTEQDAQMQGIQAIEMQITEKDEFKVQKGYFGMGIFYEDNQEIIPFIESPQNIEYDLTSAIKRLTADQLKTIGFSSGHSEHGLFNMPMISTADSTTQNNYTLVKQNLDKNYQVKTVDISSISEINGIDTLVIAGPKKEFEPVDLYKIDQFIMNGGKVIFLADQIDISSSLEVQPIINNLTDLVANYGVQLNTDLVIDSNNEIVPFNAGNMPFLLSYPYWPRLVKENFDQNNTIVNKMRSISFAWTSSVEKVDRPETEINILATTSKNGASVNQPFNLDPQQDFSMIAPRTKVPIIAEAQGKFTSYFADKEIPQPEKSENNEPGSTAILSDAKTITNSTNNSQILVIGDSDFISDEYLNRFPDNLTFFLNAVDYLTLDSDLISIRAKTIKNRPLEEVKNKTWLKVINIIIIPLIIIIIGIIKFYLRKKSK